MIFFLVAGFHGVGGPISAEKPRYYSEIKAPIFNTIESMGYKVVDPNAYNQTGKYTMERRNLKKI